MDSLPSVCAPRGGTSWCDADRPSIRSPPPPTRVVCTDLTPAAAAAARVPAATLPRPSTTPEVTSSAAPRASRCAGSRRKTSGYVCRMYGACIPPLGRVDNKEATMHMYHTDPHHTAPRHTAPRRQRTPPPSLPPHPTCPPVENRQNTRRGEGPGIPREGAVTATRRGTPSPPRVRCCRQCPLGTSVLPCSGQPPTDNAPVRTVNAADGHWGAWWRHRKGAAAHESPTRVQFSG